MKYEIKGKSGTYTVKFDKISHHMHRMNLYEWSCTCPSYQKGKRLSCKHIEKVKLLIKLQEQIKKAVPCVT